MGVLSDEELKGGGWHLSSYSISAKNGKFVENWQDEEKELWDLRVGNLQEGKYMGKLMEDKGCFSKVCYVDSSGAISGLSRVVSRG